MVPLRQYASVDSSSNYFPQIQRVTLTELPQSLGGQPIYWTTKGDLHQLGGFGATQCLNLNTLDQMVLPQSRHRIWGRLAGPKSNDNRGNTSHHQVMNKRR